MRSRRAPAWRVEPRGTVKVDVGTNAPCRRIIVAVWSCLQRCAAGGLVFCLLKRRGRLAARRFASGCAKSNPRRPKSDKYRPYRATRPMLWFEPLRWTRRRTPRHSGPRLSRRQAQGQVARLVSAAAGVHQTDVRDRTTMATALSPQNHSQGTASRNEATCGHSGQRTAEWLIEFEFERSRESRRRHRVLASAQHLAALMDCRGNRG
jgi:hypothetical protein